MPIDARIPLAGRVPQLQIPDFAGIRARSRQQDLQEQAAERQNNLLDLQQQRFAQEQTAFDEGAPLRKMQAQSAREDLRTRSLVTGAIQVKPFLDAGDIEGARAAAQRRREMLVASGIDDTAQTDEFLGLLDTDPARAAALVDNAIAAGQQLGVVSAPAVGKPFTLAPGASRFDAEGNVIASVAPRPSSGTQLVVGPDGTVTLQQGVPVGGGPLKQAAGPKKADQAFANTFVEWETGGAADADKMLGQLREVSAALKRPGASLTGPFLGLVPDPVLAFANPEAISAREAVEEVVQRNLRVVLGAQFTAKEGDRLIARAFNPRLGEAENAKRVDRLIQQMEAAAQAKNSAAAYFAQNRTLEGWNGKLATMADFSNLDFGDTGPQPDPADAAPLPGAGGTVARPPAGNVATPSPLGAAPSAGGRFVFDPSTGMLQAR